MHWLEDAPLLGVGEAASTAVPAALAKAVFDATGRRRRRVPFSTANLKGMLASG